MRSGDIIGTTPTDEQKNNHHCINPNIFHSMKVYKITSSMSSRPCDGIGLISFARTSFDFLGFAFLRFTHGINASAEILAVEIVLMRQLYGTLVAAFFLEVARQPLDAVNIALFLHDFVQYLSVLHWADGERRGGKECSMSLR